MAFPRHFGRPCSQIILTEFGVRLIATAILTDWLLNSSYMNCALEGKFAWNFSTQHIEYIIIY